MCHFTQGLIISTKVLGRYMYLFFLVSVPVSNPFVITIQFVRYDLSKPDTCSYFAAVKKVILIVHICINIQPFFVSIQDKERDLYKATFGSSWGLFLLSLSHFAVAEKNYMSLGFLEQKGFFTRSKDVRPKPQNFVYYFIQHVRYLADVKLVFFNKLVCI